MHFKLIGWIPLDDYYRILRERHAMVYSTEAEAKEHGSYAEPVYVERYSIDDDV